MGAEDRRRWSSFIRQDVVAETAAELLRSDTHGVAVTGPRGVGKTTLARSIETYLAGTHHVVRLFGAGLDTTVPYGTLALYMARLPQLGQDFPMAVIHRITENICAEAGGKPVLLILDDMPSVDTQSMGVLMHLIFSGTAKILVLARQTSDMPEDLLWLLKDGLLSETQLENLSWVEARKLIGMALGGSVAASAVTALHTCSGGNPLVLHALVSEQVGRGTLLKHNATWVIHGELRLDPSSFLSDLVQSRLAGESSQVRKGIEKMSLIRRAPLSVVMDALGHDVAAEMEERGYLKVSTGARRYASLRQPYIGETLRGWLSQDEKAALYAEMISVVPPDLALLRSHELLAIAAWAHDAGMTLLPEVALAAAKEAVRLVDPGLALKCVATIDSSHPLALQAALIKRSAYSILADYARAVLVLDEIRDTAEAGNDICEYASWVAGLTSSLLWVPDGHERIPAILAKAREHVEAENVEFSSHGRAVKILNLATFEFQVYRGQFVEAAPGLEEGFKDRSDPEYRLNCASLLVHVWAVLGRELDAIELFETIESELENSGIVLRQTDFHLHGLVLALTWTGQWQKCLEVLNSVMSTMAQSSQYSGGIVELGMGLAYTYAGWGSEATEVLLVAAAQLEMRDTYNTCVLAYSALALAFAQVGNSSEAAMYLALAQAREVPGTWINRAVGEFFCKMASNWMDDPNASGQMMESALADIACGRVTTASMSLFGATAYGARPQFELLEQVSSRRQGPMAEISVLLAQACQQKDPIAALAAANLAEGLNLPAVESRCSVVALDFAREAGDSRRARAAQERLDRLVLSIPMMPLVPQSERVRLTQRELQVAKLASRGLGNRAIAEKMGVSVRTVEGHLYQVFDKLGISSRKELMQIREVS